MLIEMLDCFDESAHMAFSFPVLKINYFIAYDKKCMLYHFIIWTRRALVIVQSLYISGVCTL